MIDLRSHFGFTRTPFGKALAPSMLLPLPAHAEAIARISLCARERALGVITGEVGAGKTVAARAAVAALDPTRHTCIYLANPATGTRGIHHHIVTALGGQPAHAPPSSPPRPPTCSPPSTANAAGSRAGHRLFRPAPLASATSGEPPSGSVTALLTCRARDVRDVPGDRGIRGAQACHRGSSRPGGPARRRPRPVVHGRVAGRGGA